MFDLVPGGITFGGRTTIFNEDFFNDLCMPKVTVKRIIWGKPIQPKGELEKFIADVDYVFYNKKKKTFGVKLKNKETITIHLQDGDTWDDEKQQDPKGVTNCERNFCNLLLLRLRRKNKNHDYAIHIFAVGFIAGRTCRNERLILSRRRNIFGRVSRCAVHSYH